MIPDGIYTILFAALGGGVIVAFAFAFLLVLAS